MSYNRIACLSIVCVAIALVSACSRGGGEDADSRPLLSVSIEPQRKILEEIAGDGYRVVSLLANGANPESYEPSIGERRAADQSLAFFTTGFMPFENTIVKSIDKSVRVVDTSTGIALVTGTHCMGHDAHNHDDIDPHVWSSMRNAQVIAHNMLSVLVEICPDSAEVYRARYERLVERLDSIDTELQARLAESGAHAFAVWHPSLSYYARDYGLHQISVGQESKEISPGTLKGVIDEARADSVQVFFFQKEYDSRQAKSINREIGSRLVIIDPLAYDWEQQLILITDELTRH